MALQLYLEGLGFRSIGRVLGFSHVAVYQWIKSFGSEIVKLGEEQREIEIVEIDEMLELIKNKKNQYWIWIAVDRYKKKFINFVIGKRDEETGKELWEKIEQSNFNIVATDYWRAYEGFITKKIHCQSKAETFTVEGYNSLFRHFLARMRRKTKCYSKSSLMLYYSVALLMAKWNGSLENILN